MKIEKKGKTELVWDGSLLSLYFRVTRKLHHGYHGSFGQQKILRVLVENGEISQKELQEILNIKAGSLSETIAKLEKKGYIVREKSEDDRRRKVISITEEGRTANKKYQETKDETAFAALTKQERNMLRELLLKVYRAEEAADEVDI